MRIKVKRFFISTVYGNVDEGRILDVPEAHGKHFIDNGLAEEVKSAGPVDVQKNPEVKPTGFSNPVVTSQKPVGSSLQADQALPKKTVRPSESGARTRGQKKGASR